jgi:hypothetical protein
MTLAPGACLFDDRCAIPGLAWSFQSLRERDRATDVETRLSSRRMENCRKP